MASSSSDIRELERTLANFLNKQLQTICSTNGLRTSGVKAELQNRIRVALIETRTSDPVKFREIQLSIMNMGGGRGHPSHQSKPSNRPAPNQAGVFAFDQPGHLGPMFSGGPQGSRSTQGYGGGSAYGSHPERNLHFKPSPFYNTVTRIGEVHTIEIMSQHRSSKTITIKAHDYPVLRDCLTDKTYRIYVFCANDYHGAQNIAFPTQSELKVNGEDVQANLRGLKGKPGTTCPVDITDKLRLKQTMYQNNFEFTYALTTKTFYLTIFLCKTLSVDELVGKIKKTKISKASVILEMTKKSSDPDIVTTSTVLSLKCPVLPIRMKVPCRSIACNHVQCFDASNYLMMQQQAPTWECQVCYKPALFEHLAVDEYVGDILARTTESVEQVTIEPDGQWKVQGAEPQAAKSRRSGALSSVDDEDDAVFITESRGFSNGGASRNARTLDTPARTLTGNATPADSSREPSTAPKSGTKRQAAEVIDLTLSSDEDDAPIARAPKRQNQGLDYNGGPGFSSLTTPDG
ncbi:hypothetical protein GGR56DRAFT_625840 [Xylariaceae sp. FL0804]|nr:hypothetical protein GGR56DRAFT_625840 [Xylariaceae sp. FL0804]